MNTAVAQMIDDANATFEAMMAAGETLAVNESLLSIDPPPPVRPFRCNYRSYWLRQFNYLGVDLPRRDHQCKFDLVIHTSKIARSSLTYVVLSGESELMLVINPRDPDTELMPVVPEIVADFAAKISSARPIPVIAA